MIIDQASDGFAEWLHDQRIAILIGLKDNAIVAVSSENGKKLNTFVQRFEGFRRFSVSDDFLAVATETDIVVHARVVASTVKHDVLFVPRTTYHVGRVDLHDIEVTSDGEALFVSSEFDSVARTNPTKSFEVVWKPPFLPREVERGDNCHLNGMAFQDGVIRCVTMFARARGIEEWRSKTIGGGVVMGLDGDILAEGLTLPHCPRYGSGRLWLCNSGTGTVGVVDRHQYEPIAFCGGFTRGLAFHEADLSAIVGISAPRHAQMFEGLPLHDALRASGEPPRSGVVVLDMESGAVRHRLRLAEAHNEVYDVGVIQKTRRPAIASPAQSERMFSVQR